VTPSRVCPPSPGAVPDKAWIVRPHRRPDTGDVRVRGFGVACLPLNYRPVPIVADAGINGSEASQQRDSDETSGETPMSDSPGTGSRHKRVKFSGAGAK
jgi:hypothetical protein